MRDPKASEQANRDRYDHYLKRLSMTVNNVLLERHKLSIIQSICNTLIEQLKELKLKEAVTPKAAPHSQVFITAGLAVNQPTPVPVKTVKLYLGVRTFPSLGPRRSVPWSAASTCRRTSSSRGWSGR